ncbi:hypothetical protein [Nocardia sp. NPDC057668]|uniref:hypothetical protein n=1 Tax=Nocardia sp. NPDC057668 TaxID=3346202 RepID=UPI00367285F0
MKYVSRLHVRCRELEIGSGSTGFSSAPRTLRVGDFLTEVPDNILNPVNDAAAGFEAAVATRGRSIGIDPSRSDKIAAGAWAAANL